MDTRTQTGIWIYWMVIVLGIFMVASLMAIIILQVMGQPLSELLISLGFIATGGLIRVLISPLTPKLME